MAETKAGDQKQRVERLAQVTPELIQKACKHPGVAEMYCSIVSHSGYNCGELYIWISWFGRGRAGSRDGFHSKDSLSGKP